MAKYVRLRRMLDLPVPRLPLPAGVTLEPFDNANAPACRDLMNRVYAELGDAPVPFEVWYSALTGDSEYDPALIWVATADGNVVGYCQCWSSNFIKDLAVDPLWRRQCLGAALLSRALRTFAGRGAAQVDLKTELTNLNARAFYARFAFEFVEQTEA